MSELAERERIVRRSWAAPGGSHDFLVQFLKILLPVMIGLLAAYLVLAPLTKGQEISFLLDKNEVDVAKERMRAEGARYQGQDDEGRPFTLVAQSAVQATSREPIVEINGMAANIMLANGPATLKAAGGHYDIGAQTATVPGQILFAAADGYRLLTQNVMANFNNRTLVSRARAVGRTPLGTFAADRLIADLAERRLLLRGGVAGRMDLGTFSAEQAVADYDQRRVALNGRARLHIVQGALR